jgi:hypothetical protein
MNKAKVKPATREKHRKTGTTSADTSAALPQSQLLGIARRMQSDAFIWSTILLKEKRNDLALFQQMQEAKTAIVSAIPTNVVDALVIAGTAQCIADFMFRLSSDEKPLDSASAASIASSAKETFIAMARLQDYFERTAGCSLQSLRLFQDGLTLQ